MDKPCVVLVTGAGGDAQGWGNMQVTESVRDAILANGYDCRIVLAENRSEMEKGLSSGPCSIVWSSLYFFSSREDIIGIPPDAVWVADVLDELNIPAEKATYVCAIVPQNGGPLYQFSYRIAGSILSNEPSWEDNGRCCHESYPYGAPDFPAPHFDIEFCVELPWVMEQ